MHWRAPSPATFQGLTLHIPRHALQQAGIWLKSMDLVLCRTWLHKVTSQHQASRLSQSQQALTTGLGHVSGFVPSYKGTSSSLSRSPPHLSDTLRDSNGTVTNTFAFSVLLPPVQISITQSDKEKMKLQSARLQVFSSMIGAVFKTL